MLRGIIKMEGKREMRTSRNIIMVGILLIMFICAQPCTYAADKALTFQEEMAKLMGQKAGPDNTGDVRHMGGLTGYYTGPKELFPGKGKYGALYNFLPLIRWYDPDYYYNSDKFHPGSSIEGLYKGEQCILCHEVENPGIVALWRRSKHASPGIGKEVVGCEKMSW